MQLKSDHQSDLHIQSHQFVPSEQQMHELVISDKLADAPISYQPVQLDKPTQPVQVDNPTQPPLNKPTQPVSLNKPTQSVHPNQFDQPSAGQKDDNLVELFQNAPKA